MSLVRAASEGQIGVSDGIHSGLDPLFVPATRVHTAVNVTFRNGMAETRPDYERVPVALPYGKFQGVASYISAGQGYLVFVVDGRIYLLRLRGNRLIPLSDQVPKMSHRVERFTFTRADRFMIVNDGINRPVILEGERARLADGAKENPLTGMPGEWGPATFGAYLYGRLAFAQTGTDAFLVGDPIIPLRYPENHLFTSENTYLQGAGAFQSASGAAGPITGVATWPLLDAPTGVGGLLIFKRDSVETYDLRVDRRAWGSVSISQVVLSRGTESHESIAVVNNDVFFRNKDGVYSLRTGRQEGDSTLFVSYSRANERFIANDSPNLLRLCSSAVFDNRLLFTCSPRRMLLNDGRFDFYHMGLVVWDHDIDGTVRNNRENADGLWTGIPITQIVAADSPGADDRCFAFTKVAGGGNELWEITSNTTGRDNGTTPIESQIHTRAFAFSGPADRKRLGTVDVWLSDLSGPGTVRYAVRTDRSTLWQTSTRGQDWNFVDNTCYVRERTGCFDSTSTSCDVPCYRAGHLARLTSDGFNLDFYEAEARLTFTGRFRLNAFRLSVVDQPKDAVSGGRDPDLRLTTLTGEPENLFSYQVAHA